MQQVVVIGCGIVGAAIAYELSQVPNLAITVLDRALEKEHTPSSMATRAALGVLMGGISQKVKGTAWNLRQASLHRYETLIPELEALTGLSIPFNRQGILMLCLEGDDLERWDRLIAIRQQQGWHLERWDRAQLSNRCPQVASDRLIGAIYSPQDRQVNPSALMLALVEAAKQRGVTFRFGLAVEHLSVDCRPSGLHHCWQLRTTKDEISADWVVIAAGLGSMALAQSANFPVPLQPVLGQGMQVRLQEPLGDPQFQPVITGDDIHLVPCGGSEYWIGATVEFTDPLQAVFPSPDTLEHLWQGAIALWPTLTKADILTRWWGVRPRPADQPAPIIKPLGTYDNVLLATGHYRNGILLAPATAQQICAMITREEDRDEN